MSESTEAILIDNDEGRIDRWLSAMTKVHACVIGGGLFDDGPSEAAIELAQDLADELLRAIDEYLNDK
jgi:hypothetical protein